MDDEAEDSWEEVAEEETEIDDEDDDFPFLHRIVCKIKGIFCGSGCLKFIVLGFILLVAIFVGIWLFVKYVLVFFADLHFSNVKFTNISIIRMILYLLVCCCTVISVIFGRKVVKIFQITGSLWNIFTLITAPVLLVSIVGGIWLFVENAQEIFIYLLTFKFSTELFCTVILFLLACYIAASILSKYGKVIITGSWLDKLMLLTVSFALCIAVFLSEPELKASETQNIFLTIAGSCLAGTMMMSVLYNITNFWAIILSVLAKLFIILLAVFIIFLLIVVLLFIIISAFADSHDDERRRPENETVVIKYDEYLDAFICYVHRD